MLSIDFLLNPLRFNFGIVAIVSAYQCFYFPFLLTVKDRNRFSSSWYSCFVPHFLMTLIYFCNRVVTPLHNHDPVVLGPDQLVVAVSYSA